MYYILIYIKKNVPPPVSHKSCRRQVQYSTRSNARHRRSSKGTLPLKRHTCTCTGIEHALRAYNAVHVQYTCTGSWYVPAALTRCVPIMYTCHWYTAYPPPCRAHARYWACARALNRPGSLAWKTTNLAPAAPEPTVFSFAHSSLLFIVL